MSKKSLHQKLRSRTTWQDTVTKKLKAVDAKEPSSREDAGLTKERQRVDVHEQAWITRAERDTIIKALQTYAGSHQRMLSVEATKVRALRELWGSEPAPKGRAALAKAEANLADAKLHHGSIMKAADELRERFRLGGYRNNPDEGQP